MSASLFGCGQKEVDGDFTVNAKNHKREIASLDGIDNDDLFGEVKTEITECVDEAISSCDSLDSENIADYWSLPYGGELKVVDDSGNKYIRYTGKEETWHSPAFDLKKVIDSAGTYVIGIRYMFEGKYGKTQSPGGILIRGMTENSFLKLSNGNVFCDLGAIETGTASETWYEKSFSLSVTEEDLLTDDAWNLCFDRLLTGVSAINIDDVTVGKKTYVYPEPYFPTTAETWVSNEMILNSDKERENPTAEAELDLIITDGTTTLKIPGFWDGGNLWRIRFSLPNAGTWTYRTECSDKSDSGLNGITGTVECTEYSGELSIY